MLDFSFSEILLCFVVALVVLGPERMPGVVRAIGKWTGKARGYMRNLSEELERETQISEMKKQIEDAHRVLRDHSGELKRTMEGQFKAVREDVGGTVKTVRDSIDESGKALNSDTSKTGAIQVETRDPHVG